MLGVTRLRDLILQAPSGRGRPAHLAAASGLVRTGGNLYVVADDELHLGVFPSNGLAPGALHRIFPGELPDEPLARKDQKPDFEVLTLLRAFPGRPHGALLALPSCSSSHRVRGALWSLDERGALAGPADQVDFSALREALLPGVPDLNIEGAGVCGDRLRLLLRGNNAQENRLAELDLAEVLRALATPGLAPGGSASSAEAMRALAARGGVPGGSASSAEAMRALAARGGVPAGPASPAEVARALAAPGPPAPAAAAAGLTLAPALLSLRTLDLGGHGGVRFTLTDGAPLPDGRMVVSAVCEDTPDSFHDGACTAAGIGLLDPDGQLARFEPLDAPYKVEGIDARQEGAAITLLLVCDADDPGVPSPLLSAVLHPR